MTSTPPSRIERTIADHRRMLAADEKRAHDTMLRAYRDIQARLLERLGPLQTAIKARQDAGLPVTRAWLQREERYRDLLTQAATQINRFATTAEAATTTQAQAALDAARTQAIEAIASSMGPTPPGATLTLNRLPTKVLEAAVAAQQDGSPLRDLFDSFGTDASERVRDVLLNAVAQGISPRETARDVQRALDVSAVRAMTIARTESLRTYRTASRETYKANRDVVARWRWLSARGPTTCAVCYAMDGQEFDLDTPLDSHPNCRCAQVPVTKTWEDMGFAGIEESVPDIGTGEDVFASLDDGVQRRILGPTKYDMYASGAIRLRDLVATTQSSVWGGGRREKGINEL